VLKLNPKVHTHHGRTDPLFAASDRRGQGEYQGPCGQATSNFSNYAVKIACCFRHSIRFVFRRSDERDVFSRVHYTSSVADDLLEGRHDNTQNDKCVYHRVDEVVAMDGMFSS
jgi:hypothetical protein